MAHVRLSDTLAGAALGIDWGRFVTQRRLERARAWNVSFAPAPHGGLMMTFSMILNR